MTSCPTSARNISAGGDVSGRLDRLGVRAGTKEYRAVFAAIGAMEAGTLPGVADHETSFADQPVSTVVSDARSMSAGSLRRNETVLDPPPPRAWLTKPAHHQTLSMSMRVRIAITAKPPRTISRITARATRLDSQ
jgi:hypothetical protein